MKHISEHTSPDKRPKKKATERGELMEYFLEKLNASRLQDGLNPITMPRMGRVLEAIPTSDLYYLKSVCDESLRRGGLSSFSKKFWWEVNPRFHPEEKKNNRRRK